MPSPAWLSRNIFDDVLHREDALTDALRNYLQYPPVRCALRRTLPDNVRRHVDFSSIEDIETRSSGGSSGIPDLVLRGRTFTLVIEVKVGAPLTGAQQRAYVDWVREQIEESTERMGFVVFLVPEDYPHRSELVSCLENARAQCRSDLRICIPPDLITWEQFVQALGSRSLSSLNELIREFHSHLSERFKPVRFTSEEIDLMLDRKTASGISKLMSVVDKVKGRLKDAGLRHGRLNPWAFGYDFTSESDSDGTDTEGGTVYFGIWWPFWEEHGYPLCIAISQNSPQSLLDAFAKYHSGVEFKDESDGHCYLVAGYGLDPEDQDCSMLIGQVTKNIEDLLRGRA